MYIKDLLEQAYLLDKKGYYKEADNVTRIITAAQGIIEHQATDQEIDSLVDQSVMDIGETYLINQMKLKNGLMSIFPNLKEIHYLSTHPGKYDIYRNLSPNVKWIFPNYSFGFYDTMTESGRGIKNDLLIPNLRDKYNSKPVHSAEEIIALKNKFPDSIRHFNVYKDDKLVCGTTLFITKKVVKSQYIAGSESNNELGSIDYLYDFLINEVAKSRDYFDFGPSHENNGLQIVKSINFWKESFGANSLIQDFYEVNTSNYVLLENVLI